jgi:uncharacterized protein (TIGR00730 family)
MRIEKVCVFCGSRPEVEEKYKELAKKCGEIIAKNHLELVYGGGDTGLMGAVAHSAYNNGAKVTGVYPMILQEREPLNPDIDHTYIVDTMYQRKEHMISKSDAFIILPGGVGTLDEFYEVITLKVLKENNKPIIVVNFDGYWDKLKELNDFLVEKKFATHHILDTYEFVDTIEECFKKLGY